MIRSNVFRDFGTSEIFVKPKLFLGNQKCLDTLETPNHGTIKPMNPEELTDEEALAAALLLGFEWEPLERYEVFGYTGFGFYNHPLGKLLAISRREAVRQFLKHHLPKKP